MIKLKAQSYLKVQAAACFTMHPCIHTPGVAYLADTVPCSGQRAPLVGGEEPEQNPLELQLVDVHPLVSAKRLFLARAEYSMCVIFP